MCVDSSENSWTNEKKDDSETVSADADYPSKLVTVPTSSVNCHFAK